MRKPRLTVWTRESSEADAIYLPWFSGLQQAGRMVSGVVVLVAVVGMIGAVVSLWLVLRFLRHVYDKGGVEDLREAATAVRAARWAFVRRGGFERRRLPTRRR